jgi:hypothetical protein
MPLGEVGGKIGGVIRAAPWRSRVAVVRISGMSDVDIHDYRCPDCGARCASGQVHRDHSAGWNKNILSWDWYKISYDGFPGWEELSGSAGIRHPPFVELEIRNKVDKSSKEISREFDNVAQGCFYFHEWSRDGHVFLQPGDLYEARWFFQKRDDANEFARRYGGFVQLDGGANGST